MLTQDLLRFSLHAVMTQRGRSLLTLIGIAIGVCAVVLLTAIGQGVHRFVLAEFSQFGTNLIAVTPGKTSTFGMSGAMISSVRPLSLADAEALEQVADIQAVVPVVQGNAEVEYQGQRRRTMVFGVGSRVPEIWGIRPAIGRFLPEGDLGSPRAFAVLGATLKQELFGHASPLGAPIRVGGERFRVIGVMEAKGQLLGFDLDDSLYLPVQRVMSMFDRDGLMEIDLLYDEAADSQTLVQRLKALLERRHGREDFTITTQDQMLEVLDSVLGVLTAVVAALGGISLMVGGIGILTIMTIAVRERRHEIGLLRALGARRREILGIFLLEAVLLALAGGLLGLGIGLGGAWLLGALVPGLPVAIAWPFVLLALGTAAGLGLAAGVLPAMQAARLDPVVALHAE